MNRGAYNVGDIVQYNRAKAVPVADRIERRIQLMTEWLRSGVPSGKTIPKSLTEARIWTDDELGILPIGSYSDFTKTNVRLGKRVQVFDELREQLLAKHARPKSTRRGSVNRRTGASSQRRVDQDSDRHALQSAVSQWHMQRDAYLAEKGRADAAERRSHQLLRELAAKDALIADLRRQLAASTRLRAVP